MYPYTNTQYGSSENITPSTEPPKLTTPSPLFVSKYYFVTTSQSMFSRPDGIFEKKQGTEAVKRKKIRRIK